MSQEKQNPDPLGGAINRLENLLQQQSQDGASNGELPILDDIVVPDEFVAGDTGEETAAPDSTDADLRRIEMENALARLTEQLEMELETLVGMLRESMLHEFRKEMEAAFDVDANEGKDKAATSNRTSDSNNRH